MSEKAPNIEASASPQKPKIEKTLDYRSAAFSKVSAILPDGPEKDAFAKLREQLSQTALRCIAEKLTKQEVEKLFDDLSDGKTPSDWLKTGGLEEAIKTGFPDKYKDAQLTAEVSKATAEVSKATAEVSKATAEVSKATAEVSKATAEATESTKETASLIKLFSEAEKNPAFQNIRAKYSVGIDKWIGNLKNPKEAPMPFSEKQELARNMLRDLAEESKKLQEIASLPTATPEQKQAAKEARSTLASFASEFHAAGLISTAELSQYQGAFQTVKELQTEKKIDAKIADALPKDSVKLSTQINGKEQYASFDKQEIGKTSFDSVLTVDTKNDQISEKIASSKTNYAVSVDYPIEFRENRSQLETKLATATQSRDTIKNIAKEYEELDRLSSDPEVADSIPKENNDQGEDRKKLETTKDRTPLEEKRLRKYQLEEKKAKLIENGAPKTAEDLQNYTKSILIQIEDIGNQLKTAPNTQNTPKETLRTNARDIIEFMDSIGLSYLGEKNADTLLAQMYAKLSTTGEKGALRLTDGHPPKIDASVGIDAESKNRIQKMFAEYVGDAGLFNQNTNPPSLKGIDANGKTIDYRAKFTNMGVLSQEGKSKPFKEEGNK